MMRRVLRRIGRRLGTAAGGSLAAILTLSGEQAMIVESAAVIIAGVGIDLLFEYMGD